MKRLILLLAAIFITAFTLSAQTPYFPKNNGSEKWTQKDSLEMHYLIRINQKAAPHYKLYKTDNIWTFLRLETATGRIWQVQYSVDSSSKRGVLPLNSVNLGSIYGSGDEYTGRFELYKTENMYNFILLDTESGAMWQAQWSFNDENRGIVRIYE